MCGWLIDGSGLLGEGGEGEMNGGERGGRGVWLASEGGVGGEGVGERMFEVGSRLRKNIGERWSERESVSRVRWEEGDNSVGSGRFRWVWCD
jgi:hypothetical protein